MSVFFCSKIFISSCFCFKTSSGATQNTSVKTVKKMALKKNHQNPVYKFMRPIIIFLDDGKCCMCEEVSFRNHVHHIDNDSSNNDAHNLITICELHHKITHSMNLKIEVDHDFIPYVEREKLNHLITKLF